MKLQELKVTLRTVGTDKSNLTVAVTYKDGDKDVATTVSQVIDTPPLRGIMDAIGEALKEALK